MKTLIFSTLILMFSSTSMAQIRVGCINQSDEGHKSAPMLILVVTDPASGLTLIGGGILTDLDQEQEMTAVLNKYEPVADDSEPGVSKITLKEQSQSYKGFISEMEKYVVSQSKVALQINAYDRIDVLNAVDLKLKSNSKIELEGTISMGKDSDNQSSPTAFSLAPQDNWLCTANEETLFDLIAMLETIGG